MISSKRLTLLLQGREKMVQRLHVSNAFDIQTDDTLLYILFNSELHSDLFVHYNDKGVFIREIVTNPRRHAYSPTSFCLDKENNIIVADHSNIRIFDHYGRPIGSIITVSHYKRSIAYDSTQQSHYCSDRSKCGRWR